MDFVNLPPEIKLLIFSHLTLPELCKYVVPVCSGWRKLAYDPTLWKTLKFPKKKIFAPTVSKALTRCPPKLRYLSLYHVVGRFDEIVSQVSRFSLLRVLKFSDCHAINEVGMAQLLAHCPLVEELKLKYCTTVDLPVIRQVTQWQRLMTLYLELQYCIDECIDILSLNCNNIQKLHLQGYGCAETDRSINALFINRGPQLTKLRLNSSNLTTETYSLFEKCENMTELRLISAVKLTDDDLKIIAKLNLRCLEVTYTKLLTNEGLSTLFNSRSLSNLEELNMTSCDNFDDGIVELLVKCCPLLRILLLNKCEKITEDGLKLIVNNCRLLKELQLQNLFEITGDCLVDLSMNLPELVYLDLSYCPKINYGVLQSVAAKNKKLSVSWRISDDYYQCIDQICEGYNPRRTKYQ